MPELQDDCKRYQKYQWHPEADVRAGDYAYARTRVAARKPHGHRLERGYEVARHFVQMIATRRNKAEIDLEQSFRAHVEKWKEETGHLSSLVKAVAHPSYLRIIGLATQSNRSEIERLLLKELQDEPDHWFPALAAITGEDPTKPTDDFDDAVAAWINWGKSKKLI